MIASYLTSTFENCPFSFRWGVVTGRVVGVGTFVWDPFWQRDLLSTDVVSLRALPLTYFHFFDTPSAGLGKRSNHQYLHNTVVKPSRGFIHDSSKCSSTKLEALITNASYWLRLGHWYKVPDRSINSPRHSSVKSQISSLRLDESVRIHDQYDSQCRFKSDLQHRVIAPHLILRIPSYAGLH